jgi:hypothetical protein
MKMHQFEPESATQFGERDMRSAARRRRWCSLCSRTNRSIRFCAFASRLDVESTCSSISLMSLREGEGVSLAGSQVARDLDIATCWFCSNTSWPIK